tara:strand:+ start:7932 stop:8708 length:777 start_codon:yes stop_codon:yes gene_type:complete
MSVDWYYVEGEKRVGPIKEEQLIIKIKEGDLGEDNFVWKKGFDNWKKLKDVSELSNIVDETSEIPKIVKSSNKRDIDWDTIKENEKVFLIKIGIDRGGQDVEYGPYSLNILKKAASEGRINGKTLLFVSGMNSWEFISDLPIYDDIFDDQKEDLSGDDRRKNKRKPFVARMFYHNDSIVYEGVCRDISVGGLQVLVDGFPGKIGDEISLNVHPENTDHSFVAGGKIVRILDGDQGFSLRFIGLSDEAKDSIEAYLEKS